MEPGFKVPPGAPKAPFFFKMIVLP